MSHGKKEDQSFNTLFLAFMGNQVTITIDILASVVHSSEAGTVTENVPLFYEGILLDEDENNFYLGKTPNEITDMVVKSKVVHMKISDESEVINQLLEQMPSPENEGEIN